MSGVEDQMKTLAYRNGSWEYVLAGDGGYSFEPWFSLLTLGSSLDFAGRLMMAKSSGISFTPG